jgi:hypothetical protein
MDDPGLSRSGSRRPICRGIRQFIKGLILEGVFQHTAPSAAAAGSAGVLKHTLRNSGSIRRLALGEAHNHIVAERLMTGAPRISAKAAGKGGTVADNGII